MKPLEKINLGASRTIIRHSMKMFCYIMYRLVSLRSSPTFMGRNNICPEMNTKKEMTNLVKTEFTKGLVFEQSK